jgi:hypothetical protein
VGIPLIVRARRRAAWAAQLEGAEAEVAWFARELVPQLRQAASVDEVAGGWAVATGRVAAAEDTLTGLETTAPGEAEQARALALRDAVRTARGQVQGLVDTGIPDAIAPTMDEVRADLETALEPPPPPTPAQ